MEYEDFSIKIEPRQNREYPVIVLRSPAGEGRSSFVLPIDLDEINVVISDLGETVRGGIQEPLRSVSPAATATLPQRIGDQLFEALFSGAVRTLLDLSLGMLHRRQRGLRIKLHIDPEDPSLAQLASLPWEFLYRKETRDFLNLSRFTPVLRYLDVQRPYAPLLLEPPLRILVVIADPSGFPWLDLQRERALIEASWAHLPGVQVEFLEPATIMQLQERLADQPFHVLHFMGHGSFDERTGRGVLLMKSEQGGAVPVDGGTLGVLLHDVPTLRLVFLNACETAKVTREKGLDPFAGVASSMVLAGIPAVVAMQFPITDRAAITFARRFYTLLARGEAVDTAVAEGRRSIRVAQPDTMEWGTPVLFMRAPQGVVFQLSGLQSVTPQPVSEEPDQSAAVDGELGKRLEQLYSEGLSAYWLEDWAKAEDCFQAINHIAPEFQDTSTKLAEAKRQRTLAALYAEAVAAQEHEEWSKALAALEQLTALSATYRDGGSRLSEVRKQKQLADLYVEARQLSRAEQWQAVVNIFAQIRYLQPDFADTEGLLPPAEQQIARLRRQEEMNRLMNQALRAMEAGRWQEAERDLAQVIQMEASYRGADRLMEKVQDELARQREERQRQERIATLYEQASALLRARQWRAALASMAEIQNLDPEFADRDGIAAKAAAAVTRDEEESQRQSALAALYADAVRLVEAGRYQEALEKWGEIHTNDPQYPDQKNVQTTARKHLDHLARGAGRGRRTPVRAASVALLAVAAIAVVLFLACRDGRCASLLDQGTSESTTSGQVSTSNGARPFGVAAGTWFHFTSDREGKREIYRQESSGQEVRITNTVGSRESWSPALDSGRVLYFTSNRDGKREIYRLDNSGRTVRMTNTPGNAESWSPIAGQGGVLYLVSDRDGSREIYRLDMSGKILQVTNTAGSAGSWSPAPGKGPVLVFVSDRSGKREIYWLDESGTVARVTNTVGSRESWSPALAQGGALYFTSNRDGKREIYRLDTSGRTVRVTNTAGRAESWSPAVGADGSLLFTSDRDGTNEIYRIGASGEVVQVTDTPQGAGSWLGEDE